MYTSVLWIQIFATIGLALSHAILWLRSWTCSHSYAYVMSSLCHSLFCLFFHFTRANQICFSDMILKTDCPHSDQICVSRHHQLICMSCCGTNVGYVARTDVLVDPQPVGLAGCAKKLYSGQVASNLQTHYAIVHLPPLSWSSLTHALKLDHHWTLVQSNINRPAYMCISQVVYPPETLGCESQQHILLVVTATSSN